MNYKFNDIFQLFCYTWNLKETRSTNHRKEAITMTNNYKTNSNNFIARGMVILPSICIQ